MSRTRNPVLSGTWYPDEPQTLAAAVDRYLAGAQPDQMPAGRPLVAVVPHAGYQYSGATAGQLYGLLRDDIPGRVFILSPNHRTPLHRIALSSASSFATPLGLMPTNDAATIRLADHPLFSIDDQAHAEEHAIEIQLPFLQRIWPDNTPDIVPLLVPAMDGAAGREAARALRPLLDNDSLLLVSTDFTHYGASYGYLPFTSDIPAELEKLDAGAILNILAADGAGLREYGHRTGITMCGLSATALALDCGLPAGYEGSLLHYARSGDRDGNYESSVSYAAVLLSSGPSANPTGDNHA